MSKREIASILKLGVPVAMTHLANIMMQVVDMFFVGKLSPEAIGATGLGNAIFAFIMLFGIGVLLGLDYYISKAFGAGDQDEANRLLVQGVYLALFFSIPASLTMFFASGWFDFIGTDRAVSAMGDTYLSALSLSLIPWLLFTVLRQYHQAMGIALPAFAILIVGNILNACGNWAFIFGNWGFKPMGIAGSGYATCVARTFMMLAILTYVLWKDARTGARLRKVSLAISSQRIESLFRLGFPAAIQILLEVGVFTAATFLAGKIGTLPLAAHQIVLQIASVTFMVPLGLSAAASVRVAQALGSDDRDRAYRIGWLSFSMGGLVMLGFGIVMYLAATPLLGLFTSDAEVIRIGTGLLVLAAFFQLFDGIQIVGTGVLRGIGNTRASMIANLLGHWLVGLPLGILLCFTLGWGAYGLWFGLTIGLIFVAIVLLWVWRKKTMSSVLAA